MNQDILQRAMFAMPLSKEARNTGIMQGFEDEIDMAEEDMGEDMLPMERTPQNPEILMNNLRGDMRSVDARYTELAGMVGEEAAMETPPEVLAILQDHFAMMDQPQGIGALPQGAGMAPPGMMPQGPMPMDQGAGMPPAGMEGMPPFPQGGSEGAPPTPDGLPPAQMAYGGVASVASRFAPYVMATGAALRGGLSRFNQAANQYLGNVLFRGGAGQRMTQPFLQNARGPGGRYTAQQSVQGGQQVFPTMTQGASQLMAQNPMLRSLTGKRAMGIGGLGGLAMYGQSGDETSAAGPEIKMTPEGVPYGKPTDEVTAADQAMFPPLVEIPKPSEAAAAAAATAAGEPAVTTETPATGPETATPIDIWEGVEKQPDWITQAISAPPKTEKSDRMDRIRKGTEEYKALFKDIIGSDESTRKANAWFLLADAGLKLASTAEPTMAMAIGKSFAGLPAGLSKIVSDARANDVKISTSALNAAIGDIEAQEEFGRDLQLKLLDLQNKVRLQAIKSSGSGGRFSLGAVGIVEHKNDKGDVVDYSIPVTEDDHRRMGITYNPALNNVLESPNTLNAGSPFTEGTGQGTYPSFDKDTRLAAMQSIRDADVVIGTVKDMMALYGQGFGPGSALLDIANTYIVPFIPGKEPIFAEKQAVIQKFKQLQEKLTKQLGAAGRSGRLSVQQEKWIREAINLDAAKFFQDKGTVLLTLSNLLTSTINGRQDNVGVLVPLKETYQTKRIPTGLANDPFDLTSGNREATQRYMLDFAKRADPQAQIYANVPGQGVVPLTAGDYQKWFKQ